MIIGTVPLIGDNLNYPKEVQFTNGNRIQYIYSPDGQKLRATWQTAVANIVVPLNSTVNLSSSQISSTTRTDYIGNVIYTGTASSSSASVKLSKYLFEGGYATVTPTTQPVFHYFTQDHLGNNRAVVNQSGTVEQITHYYPFGGFFADQGTNSSLQPYKYNGKELDRMHGLDLYDYGFRQYDPVVPMFTQQDPMAEKYHHLSPYAYCGNNPVNAIDVKGDSTAVVNMGYGTNQHIALLIQNENNEWQYYSFNGTPIYNLTNGKFGGGPHDNLGEKAFKSPQEFLDSDYNTYEGHPKERMGRDEINGYGYNEAYVLPTSAEQDKTIKETFESKINEGYSLIRNHCGHAVQEALNSVGIKTSVRIYNNETLSYEESVPFLPSNTFIFIKTNRSGITLYRNK